jgi:serine/threonine protein kinase
VKSLLDSGGTDHRWDLVGRLFHESIEAGADRSKLLERACAADPELRREVESLLQAHERTGAADVLEQELQERLRGGGPEVGGLVGPYRIVEKLGGGSMGLLFAARDERVGHGGRTVALKVLPDLQSMDPIATRRFLAEARAAAMLEHPNLCEVLEFAESECGRLYLAMPLYHGETLAARIARAPLEVEEALTLAIAVLQGLMHAHLRGIIHRDVKPANLFLLHDGGIRILDFGVAKISGLQLTFAGVVLGTLPYMSPEQALSRAIDGRSDLWSLGVVIYEMMAGRRPFDGDDPHTIVSALLRSEPAPLAGMRGAAVVNRLLASLLAKQPDDRFADAVTTIIALQAALEEVRAPGPP